MSQQQTVVTKHNSKTLSANKEEEFTIPAASNDYDYFTVDSDLTLEEGGYEEVHVGVKRRLDNTLYDFVKNEGLPEDTIDKISEVIQEIDTFLELKNTMHEIHTGIFIDREEPTEKEIELTIRAKGDLAYIYDNLKSPIYDIVIKTFPVETLKKMLINFEPL